jgi:hypothetical protein
MGGFRTFSDRDAMARMRNNRSFVGDPGQIDPLLVGPGVEGMRQARTSAATRIGALTVAQIRSAALETRLCHYLLKIVGEDARLL